MKRTFGKFFYSVVLILLALVSVSFFWRENLLLTLLVILESAVMFRIWGERKDVFVYAVVGIGGALSEAVAIYFGAWSYAQPDAIGIPVWLPFLWGLVGVFVPKLYDWLNEFSKK